MAYKKKVVKKKGGNKSSGFADIIQSLTAGGLAGLFSGQSGIIPGMPGASKNRGTTKKVTIKK